MQRTLSLSAHGNSAHKNNVSCHSELVSESYVSKTLKLVQGDNIVKPKLLRAFSLIEVMLGLIVVSVMVAAFAPVITKKISNTTVALSTLSSGEGTITKYQLFRFDKPDGCVPMGNYVRCPFDIPEEVSEISFVMVSGGGGGGGGRNADRQTPTQTASAGQTITIPISRATKNVKVNHLASGGGGGGGGYWYYNYTPSSIIRPANQTDCDKVAVNSKYKNGVCITKRLDLADITAPHSIKTLKSNTGYSTYQGTTKICWTSGNTGYKALHESCPSQECTNIYWYGKTSGHFDVCSYDAAYEMCRLYNYGTSTYGKWRLPTGENEINKNWEAYNMTKNGDADAPASHKCHYGPTATYKSSHVGFSWYKFGWKCTADGSEYTNKDTEGETPTYYYNPCMPNQPWLSTVAATEFTADDYYHENANKCQGWWDYQLGVRSAYIMPDDAKMGALAVQCVLDDLGTRPEVHTYNYSSGGGGGSGRYASNITVPQDKINAADGGTIVIYAGRGGAGGSASTNGGTAYNGANGEASYIQVKNKSGTVLWTYSLEGGKGGGRGAYSSAGAGAGAITGGNRGTNGSNQTSSGSVIGGYGGGAVSGFAPGGQGGSAFNSSASSGSAGGGGYASVTYESIKIGGPGGGGGGGQMIKVEQLKVTPSTTIGVLVGGGGTGGNNSNGGAGGTSAVCKNVSCSAYYYYITGGNGGTVGTLQANPSTAPTAGTFGAGANSGSAGRIVGSNGGAGVVGALPFKGIGGVGGLGGLANFYKNTLHFQYNDISVGCGGYYGNSTDAQFKCSNGNVNASYRKSSFDPPGQIYRATSTKYGQAGSGGGGGGIDPSALNGGIGSKGQDGYVYIWWKEPLN